MTSQGRLSRITPTMDQVPSVRPQRQRGRRHRPIPRVTHCRTLSERATQYRSFRFVRRAAAILQLRATRSVIRLATAIALATLLVGCAFGRPAGVNRPDIAGEIERRARASDDGDIILLNDLAPDIEWSRLVAVGPYPESDDFERAAGFSWNISAAASAVTEGNTVALVQDSRVVAWANLGSGVYFLPEEDTSFSVAKADLMFRVVVEEGSSRRLDLVGDPPG